MNNQTHIIDVTNDGMKISSQMFEFNQLLFRSTLNSSSIPKPIVTVNTSISTLSNSDHYTFFTIEDFNGSIQFENIHFTAQLAQLCILS